MKKSASASVKQIIQTSQQQNLLNSYIIKIRTQLYFITIIMIRCWKALLRVNALSWRAIKIKWISTYLEQYKKYSFLDLRVLEYFYPIEMVSDTSDISSFTHFPTSSTDNWCKPLHWQFFFVFSLILLFSQCFGSNSSPHTYCFISFIHCCLYFSIYL